jgi:hypothetical protein
MFPIKYRVMNSKIKYIDSHNFILQENYAFKFPRFFV